MTLTRKWYEHRGSHEAYTIRGQPRILVRCAVVWTIHNCILSARAEPIRIENFVIDTINFVKMSRSFHDKLGKVFVYSLVGFRPFPSGVSVLWNLWRYLTPLGSPCPTKTKGWTMWWTNLHGIDILWHGKHRSTRKNQVYFTLHILELPEWLVPRYIFTTW